MAGSITRHVTRKNKHRCKPPNIWRRWRGDIGVGSVWRCDVCESAYKFEEPGMFTMGFGIWVEIPSRVKFKH